MIDVDVGAGPHDGTFEVTVLGSAGSHPGPGRVCSGYLVRGGGANVLLDAGNGSTANLQLVTRFRTIDAVLVTHRHIDHCIDLVGMFYALRFDPTFDGRVELYAPAEVRETLTGVLSADSAHEFEQIFDCHEVTGGDRFDVAGIAVEVFDAQHPPPSVSYRLSADGAVLAYSGDTAGDRSLVACARDADLFLCEATWQGEADGYPQGVHLVARDAGRVATEAGARHLMITHVAGGLDVATSRAEASETFDGPVDVAEDLTTWTVG